MFLLQSKQAVLKTTVPFVSKNEEQEPKLTQQADRSSRFAAARIYNISVVFGIRQSFPDKTFLYVERILLKRLTWVNFLLQRIAFCEGVLRSIGDQFFAKGDRFLFRHGAT